MIRIFKGVRRLFFFPVGWANSVSNWILGVHSPSGTIKVKNTSTPDADGSLEIDVNVDVLMTRIVTELRNIGKHLTTDEVEKIRTVLRGYIDGTSIVIKGNHIAISETWLQKVIKDAIQNYNADESTAYDNLKNLPSGFQQTANLRPLQDGGHSFVNTRTGLRCKIAFRGADDGQDGGIYFRECVITADGRFQIIGNETDAIGVYTSQN